ncbi:MAG: ParB/RepB/Spo0J family partition protein [Actinomycetota bacterium]|nr:ParB/RepB/Spo0J family partition protein [Actinomycetota bacterium]
MVGRRSGLGRGLSALIPEGAVADTESGGPPTFAEIPISQVQPNPHQPRVHFDEESLADLASSIAELGVLQPILVHATADGRYQLIAGERRWRAAERAGKTTVPALIRSAHPDAEKELVEQALVENLHREDLTPLEEAAAYQQLLEEFQLTHDQIATRVGRSRSAITNTLRLLSLPPAVQHLLADAKLSAGHARALLGTPDRSLQEALARQAAREGWSVRAVEQAVRESAGDRVSGVDGSEGVEQPPGAPGSGRAAAMAALRPPGLLELEQLLADHLQTRVAVQMSAKRGKVTIDFADLEDLERIYRRIADER